MPRFFSSLSRSRLPAKLLAGLVLVGVAAVVAPACSLGEGTGTVSGELDVPDCWQGPFDLKPDFFAAETYQTTLTIRIQNGSDFEEFSDGLEILLDDYNLVEGLIKQSSPDETPALQVGLPAGVTTPGVPLQPNPDPAQVHVTLYLNRSCRIQNDAIYAMDSVQLNSAGECAPEPVTDGGAASAADASANDAIAAATACGSFGFSDADPEGGAATEGAPAAASTHVGHSVIRFRSVYLGDPTGEASERLNDGSFDLYFADPRNICAGGASVGAAPPPCSGHVTGSFSFYFERGRPAQPFP